MDNVKPSPFLKWAGGKSQLLSQFDNFFPRDWARYFEPFLGAGAVFFHLAPRTAFLSDANSELIQVYRVVKRQVNALIGALAKLQSQNARDDFYRLRALDPQTLAAAARAARLIYLNKTCYNGLYRVNRAGKFNVPFGDYKHPTICDAEGLRRASAALKRATIRACDFEEAVADARRGDFVYFDPPYAPLTRTASFTSYTQANFGMDDQARLARVFGDLDRRGARVMLSDSARPEIAQLYHAFRIERVQANRAINSVGAGRGKIDELVVMNYEADNRRQIADSK